MKIYVQKVFPWGVADWEGKNELRDKINAEIEKQVKDLPNVTILDLSQCFLDAEGKLDMTAMTEDKVHLQKRGYERWAEFIGPYVRGEK
ncbi:MAG: hypothetical protein HUK22_06640 [Thermoguttaceae bacterium]|nr:hypothetical protein [Thermoguttaceae bacterium]